MKVGKAVKNIALKMGMAMAKIDTNTSCLWINYQPSEPDAIVKMRKEHTKNNINYIENS